MNLVINIIKIKKTKRWVIYNGEINASKITADWFRGCINISNNVPNEKLKNFIWQKPHKENKTGTKESFKPNDNFKK